MHINAQPPVLVFDLGGVLVTEGEAYTGALVPPFNGKQLPHQRSFIRTFEFISFVKGTDYLRAWLLGHVSGAEIIAYLDAHIDNPLYGNFFKSSEERHYIKHAAAHIILPKQLIDLTTLQEEGLAFVRQYRKAGHRLLILSNWDPDSFIFARQKFPELFSLFAEEDILIPVKTGLIKPDRALFEYIAAHTQRNPEEIIFIDDSQRNVQAAVEYGISGILHKNWRDTEEKIKQSSI